MSSPQDRTLRNDGNVRDGVLLGQWTRLLFEGLIRGGVRDAIISPGSRSTPLALEALRRSEIRCHSVIDERSAGFFALGMARVTGVPALLICTSGSALSHYLPALIEAYQSGLPLLVMSADRPTELLGCGAPQTIDQEGIFGNFARSVPRLSEPTLNAFRLQALLRKGEQAAAMSLEGRPGPVHINVPLPKPLSPLDPTSAEEREFAAMVDTLCSETSSRFLRSSALASREHRQLFLDRLNAGTDPLLISLGPTNHQAARLARTLASLLDVPLVSEFSQAGSSAPLDALAAQLHKSALSLRVLHVGPPCVSAKWNDFLRDDQHGHLHLLPGEHYLDPSNRAENCLLGGLGTLLPALIDDLKDGAFKPALGRSREIFAQLSSLSERLPPALEGLRASTAVNELPEALAVHAVLESMRNEDSLLLANSLTLRLATWVAPASPTQPQAIYTARGANGIDGFIATSCGTALHTQGPCIALVGDVTFAHDLGSLALCPQIKTPLVFVLLDNGGGRIFDHLPAHAQWGADPAIWEFWSTAPVVNFQKAVEAFQLPYALCLNESDLRQALAAARTRGGVSVVHVKTHSQSTQAFLTHLNATLPPC